MLSLVVPTVQRMPRRTALPPPGWSAAMPGHLVPVADSGGTAADGGRFAALSARPACEKRRKAKTARLRSISPRRSCGRSSHFSATVAGKLLGATTVRLSWRRVMDGTPGQGTRGDVRWMTYRELGKARGISAASAARLAFRKGWQRQPGNDGAARVAVPIGEDQPSPYDARTGAGDAARGGAPGHGARGVIGRGAREARNPHAAEFALAIDALRGELTASHQREAEAQARADAAVADRRAADAKADRAEERADALRGTIDDLRAERR